MKKVSYKPMRYCKGCTYPEVALNAKFDSNGYSSTYLTHKSWQNIKKMNGTKEKKFLKKLLSI